MKKMTYKEIAINKFLEDTCEEGIKQIYLDRIRDFLEDRYTVDELGVLVSTIAGDLYDEQYGE